jgi:hypothetical protein
MNVLSSFIEQEVSFESLVLNYYGGNKVQHIMHVFALPYHHNAFFAAKAVHTRDSRTTVFKF